MAIVVTAGRSYIDIDAYAGCIAYAVLLNAMGKEAYAVSSPSPNGSVTSLIKDLGYSFADYKPTNLDKFIILDVSNPKVLDSIVINSNIIEVIDHHVGWEDYWAKRDDVNVNINFIGSVCTVIFEKFVENRKLKLLDKNLCKLLIAGILDNTLNLKANITTKRDIDAYKRLLKIGRIKKTWKNEYFLSCQKEIEKDLEKALVSDFKAQYINDFVPMLFGQLLILNKKSILNNLGYIKDIFNKHNKDWILNLICLKDGKSYIITESKTIKNNFGKIFKRKFNKDILVLKKFMLRKEIIKKVIEWSS